MKLLLIRHGETVDNVAGIYAGVRDSALTNHGVLQARRLGAHLADRLRLEAVFASDLQRAAKTAEALVTAQKLKRGGDDDIGLAVVQLPILRELDFGSLEGKSYKERARGAASYGDGFQEPEGKPAMARRMNAFLDDCLMPLLVAYGEEDASTTVDTDTGGPVFAVVSHGMILSMLWKCLLKRLDSGSVTLAAGVTTRDDGTGELEHLGAWSNTGVLELDLQPPPAADDTVQDGVQATEKTLGALLMLHDWKMLVKAIDSKEHLVGLKRARGGLGSSRHDEGQKNIETFFKKQKTG